MTPRPVEARTRRASPRRGAVRARSRPRPSRRRRKWANRALVGLVVAASAVLLTNAARNAEVLVIDTMAVAGHAWMSEGEVLGLLAPLRGENLLDADLEGARAVLLGSGWIRDATLRRVFPSTIEVQVTERMPFALARFGERLYLMDAEGYLIDQFGPRYAEVDLPIVDGLPAPAETEDGVVSGARTALAARVVADLAADPNLAARVSQIEVTNPHDAVVLLSGDPAFVHLGEGAFAERLRTYVDVAQAIRLGVASVDAVDMRFGRQVFVRPATLDGRSPDRR